MTALQCTHVDAVALAAVVLLPTAAGIDRASLVACVDRPCSAEGRNCTCGIALCTAGGYAGNQIVRGGRRVWYKSMFAAREPYVAPRVGS